MYGLQAVPFKLSQFPILSARSGFPDLVIFKNVISITDRGVEQLLRFSNDVLCAFARKYSRSFSSMFRAGGRLI
jgi:hypothetical protein